MRRYREKQRQETPTDTNETPCNASVTPVQRQETPRTEKNREEKNREEKREAYASCSEPEADSKPHHAIPPDETPVFISIPLRGLKAGDFHVTEAMISEWQLAFPAVDIRQQLRNIRQWNLAHPAQQKTRKGVGRHIVTWLVKEQDRGRSPTMNQQRAAVTGGKLERTISNMQDWLTTQGAQQ